MARPRPSDSPVTRATGTPAAPGRAHRRVHHRVAAAGSLGLLATILASAFAWQVDSLEADALPSQASPQSPTSSAGAPPLDERCGTVMGRVTTEDGTRVPELVVYLEALDAAASDAPPPGPAVISQRGAQFSPSLLVICVGQQVRFLNDEDRPVEHNVFSNSPAKRFDLGLYSPGGSKLVTFDRPGAVSLHCSIHQNMNGVILVVPTPYFARVDRAGSYTIAGVPPGEYRLKVWQRVRRFNDYTRSVALADLSAVTVDILLSRDP